MLVVSAGVEKWLVLCFRTQLEQFREPFRNKCCDNLSVKIYNSDQASKPTAAKMPAFSWKLQAFASQPLPSGDSMLGEHHKPYSLVPTERSLPKNLGPAVCQNSRWLLKEPSWQFHQGFN